MCASCNEAQCEFILYATHSLTSLCLPFLLWSAHHMLHITVKLLICRPPCCVQLLHHRPGLISASHRLYPTTTTTRVACVNNSFAYNMMSSPWGLIRLSSSLCTLRVNICSLLPKSFSLTCFSMLSRNIRVAKRSFNLLHDCFFFSTGFLLEQFSQPCFFPPDWKASSQGKTRTDFFSGSLVAKCEYKCYKLVFIGFEAHHRTSVAAATWNVRPRFPSAVFDKLSPALMGLSMHEITKEKRFIFRCKSSRRSRPLPHRDSRLIECHLTGCQWAACCGRCIFERYHPLLPFLSHLASPVGKQLSI